MNLIESDFDTYLAYNDYLEKIEEYTIQLLEANGADQRIFDELEEFKEKHLTSFTRNAKLQTDEIRRLKMQIQYEESEKTKHENAYLLKIQKANYEKASTHAKLITELETSSKPATVIIEKSLLKSKPSTTTYLPSSSSKKMAKDLSSFGEDVIEGVEEEIHDNLPSFDPLEGCFTAILPINMPKVPHDPVLDGWICRTDVVAGGCKIHMFQQRALQASYAVLNQS